MSTDPMPDVPVSPDPLQAVVEEGICAVVFRASDRQACASHRHDAERIAAALRSHGLVIGPDQVAVDREDARLIDEWVRLGPPLMLEGRVGQAVARLRSALGGQR